MQNIFSISNFNSGIHHITTLHSEEFTSKIGDAMQELPSKLGQNSSPTLEFNSSEEVYSVELTSGIGDEFLNLTLALHPNHFRGIK